MRETRGRAWLERRFPSRFSLLFIGVNLHRCERRLDQPASSRQASSVAFSPASRLARLVPHLVGLPAQSSTSRSRRLSLAMSLAHKIKTRLYDPPLARLFLALAISIAIVVCLLQGEALHTSREGVAALKRIADAPKQAQITAQQNQVSLLLLSGCGSKGRTGRADAELSTTRPPPAAAPLLAPALRPSFLAPPLHTLV